MKNTYIFEYLDENDFRKKERSVRKYNMLAYKKLTFTYYPELRKGTFLGKEVKKDEKAKTISYELQLPTDELFKKVQCGRSNEVCMTLDIESRKSEDSGVSRRANWPNALTKANLLSVDMKAMHKFRHQKYLSALLLC